MKAWTTGYIGDGEACTAEEPEDLKTFVPKEFELIKSGIAYVQARYRGAAVMMENGEVRMFGAQIYGETCDGPKGPGEHFQYPPVPSLLTPLKPLQIAMSGAHGAAILPSGQMVTWGTTSEGVSGNGEETAEGAAEGEALNHYSPTYVGTEGNGVIPGGFPAFVDCGSRHVLVMLRNGRLVFWGAGGSGQKADGTHEANHPAKYPELVPLQPGCRAVSAIAAGGVHNLSIENGRVYAWGDNSFGQCGVVNKQKQLTAIHVPIPEEIVKIAAGGKQSLAISRRGNLYRWGQINKANNEEFPVPTLWAEDCTSACAGSTPHGHAVCSGEYIGWGNNVFGEIGDNNYTGELVENKSTHKFLDERVGIESEEPRGTGLKGLSAEGGCTADEFQSTVWG